MFSAQKKGRQGDVAGLENKMVPTKKPGQIQWFSVMEKPMNLLKLTLFFLFEVGYKTNPEKSPEVKLLSPSNRNYVRKNLGAIFETQNKLLKLLL